MSLSNTERTWLKGLFQKYYRAHPLALPYDVSRREFGHGSIKKIDARHVTFENQLEFNHFLANNTPLYVSASVSEFFNPGVQPMSAKGIMGSDLIYEFDADDNPTDCKQVHDSWSCPNCNANGKGRVMKCTSCAHGTILAEWVCSECVGATKQKTLDLVKVLQDDFGFADSELFFNFSGSKGYHIHVRSPAIYNLPKHARVELMDYLSMHEFDPESHGFTFDGKLFHAPAFARSTGHARRIQTELIRLMEVGTEAEWMILSGSSPRTLKSFLENRKEWTRDILSGVLPALPGKKTEAFWKGVLSSITDKFRSPMDRQTSGDIYRLIRVPDTLHGSTGLAARTIPFSQLPQFDPFTHAVVFSSANERKLLVHTCPLIRMGNETLGPLVESEATVSEAMAAYLVGWGAAELR